MSNKHALEDNRKYMKELQTFLHISKYKDIRKLLENINNELTEVYFYYSDKEGSLLEKVSNNIDSCIESILNILKELEEEVDNK